MTTKQELIFAICANLGIAEYRVSNGSTEPKEFLAAVAFNLGLVREIETHKTKQELAKLILQSFGCDWTLDYQSAGGTVTKKCLEVIAELVSTLK